MPLKLLLCKTFYHNELQISLPRHHAPVTEVQKMTATASWLSSAAYGVTSVVVALYIRPALRGFECRRRAQWRPRPRIAVGFIIRFAGSTLTLHDKSGKSADFDRCLMGVRQPLNGISISQSSHAPYYIVVFPSCADRLCT